MAPYLSVATQLARHVRRPSFWIVLGLMVLISIPYYDQTLHPPFVRQLMDELGLDRHAFERILYLVPIITAGFLFGHRGAFLASAFALAAMLPQAIFVSPSAGDAVFETVTVFIVGNITALAFRSLHRERERTLQLAAVNQTSLIVSQSLEIDPVLNSSVESVSKVMGVEVAIVYLIGADGEELVLAAHHGVSERFAQGVDRLLVGEGLNGWVAQTGEPAYIENASSDPRLTRTVLREENLKSMLIVPLRSKDRVLGTISAATRRYRKFRPDEVELLTSIGNQIGVALDNARLYQHERQFAEQLRASEERYRELFENAHDAIWLHDLNQDIIGANRSCVRLTGYSVEELRGLKATDLVSGDPDVDSGASRDALLSDEGTGRLSEATLVKKDGAEAYVQLSTSPIFSNGRVVAFQHIARDVTEERRMKENMGFYLQQVTKAQEEERKRIARELHDDTIQELIVLSRELDDIASKAQSLSGSEKDRLEKLWQQANGIVAGVRRIGQDLRPATLDRLGLLPSLEWLASSVREHSGIAVDVVKRGAERRINPDHELVLFRIVQEALSNVWRHSGASSAEVAVEFRDSSIKITVADDGKGFSIPAAMGDLAKEGKLGLAGMQERAKLLGGTISLKSGPAKGTLITVEVPI